MSDTLTSAPARNWIAGGGQEGRSGETYEKRSPWRPAEGTGVYAASRAQDVAAAEMGKPLREARLEAARTAAILRFSAGEAFRPVGEVFEASVPHQRLYTLRRALGVVRLITPWNFPA